MHLQVSSEFNDRSVRLLGYGSGLKRPALSHVILNLEVAAVHVDRLLTTADI